MSGNGQLRSKEEERSLQLLHAQTRLLVNRYETGLIWRYDNIRLPPSRDMALHRHECLIRKLKRNPELARSMIEKMKEYEAKGYVRRLTEVETQRRGPRDWYLPIFPVTNPNKPGKVRVVFDAAAKSKGVSLNDFLLPGPDQLSSLVAVLHKFREGKTALVGDIREMFFQVRMRAEDQQSQRFFWVTGDDLNENPCLFAVAVMTFGATCSPSSAQHVMNTNAERFNDKFPRAVTCIRDEHYVDDMLTSTETDEEALKLAQDVRYVHAQGGFEIRNWVSNSKDVVQQLLRGQVNPSSALIQVTPDSPMEKVLGLWWDTDKDVFHFRLSPRHDKELLRGSKAPTKRELLRFLMTIYDPLGLIGNYLMGLKMILQDAWRSGRQWDDALDEELNDKWRSWVATLPALQEVSVPRCYRKITPASASAQLHIFCDAGEGGMVAVAYFRFSTGHIIECALIGSKSKVTPLKPTSIPRLELQAAIIGTRYARHILGSQRINVSRRIFWTDSRNVICWLTSDHRRYTPFVAFRVGEILETTDAGEWRWLPTKLNVADEGTKWRDSVNLLPSSRWFRGPEFLWEKEEEWPATLTDLKEPQEEVRKTIAHHSVKKEEPPIEFTRFSKWKRLLRATAYVSRFINNALSNRRGTERTIGTLTCDELSAAANLIYKQAQREAFPTQQPYTRRDSPLFQLAPETDDHGVLRMRGRLARCPMVDASLQRPIIMPRRHYVTDLLIQDYHERYFHVNHRTVVSEIRRKYYIPKLLVEYNRIRRLCQLCKIRNAKPRTPQMGDIPNQRVAVSQRPFTYCGIDYFGPMSVMVGRRTEKRWGVIFTCLTVRAIHLEISSTLTTTSCIMAIRRFIASRGHPVEMISDCGTNFIGAARELQAAVTDRHIKWTFNPPGAPHFGGCWERLIQSVKKTMERMDLPRVPTDEVLYTTLKEIELIINSRPLTYIPLDDEDAEPITPNHLLLGSSNGEKPPTTLDDSAEAIQASWNAAQHNADAFWKLWVRDYLPTLTRRTKWFQPSPAIEIGEVAIIVDNNLPRRCWPKGRVVDVRRAPDGQVRRVRVRIGNNIYERPATKIAIVDVKGNHADETN
ncbi:uncharacterized protein LOC125955513 [Anopheles darlingi]|uniref:uncharacterized protein LOC125955513 n=1 Tax=Anopheles darlingi TaxID=43151 RepID=UPI00210063AC|nr:uncharacterized protein LOC125955513 [Anopheles darlingi]